VVLRMNNMDYLPEDVSLFSNACHNICLYVGSSSPVTPGCWA
jgi:hypothetical protein